MTIEDYIEVHTGLYPGWPKERMSTLFWSDLKHLAETEGIVPQEILPSIVSLESGGNTGGTKAPRKFTHDPLKGLWHKHYFCGEYLPENVKLASGNGTLEKIVTETCKKHREISSTVTEALIEEIAYRVSTELIEHRHRRHKLTGEWIVFAKSEEKNYYLCLAKHDDGDPKTYNRIMSHCASEFPNLKQWIKEN